MKSTLLPLSILLVLANQILAQNVDNQKFIEVTATAEKVIEPTEIHYQISLKTDDLNSENYDITPEKIKEAQRAYEIKLAERHRQILGMLWQEGVKESDLVVEKYKIQSGEMNGEIVVRFADFKKLEVVVARLQASKMCSGQVSQKTNPNAPNIAAELGVEAFKKAKAEAQKLADAAGLTLGKAIQIRKDNPEYATNNGSSNGWTTYPPPSALRQLQDGSVENFSPDKLAQITLSQSLTVRFSIE